MDSLGRLAVETAGPSGQDGVDAGSNWRRHRVDCRELEKPILPAPDISRIQPFGQKVKYINVIIETFELGYVHASTCIVTKDRVGN